MSHTSPRSLRLLPLVLAGALVLAGCGSGRQSSAGFVSAEPVATPTVASAAPVVAPPAFGASSARRAAPAAAATAATTADDADARTARRAERRRRVAQRRLRHERNAAERASKRAAARERALRRKLAAARVEPAPRPAPARGNGQITASDVLPDLDAQHASEARAAVLRWHELLDERDAEACSLMTAALLRATFGAEAGAADRCRSAIASFPGPVSVVIDDSSANGARARVHVTSTVGDQRGAPDAAPRAGQRDVAAWTRSSATPPPDRTTLCGATPRPIWRGAGAVERARLEIVCGLYGPPRVRIPPSPLLLLPPVRRRPYGAVAALFGSMRILAWASGSPSAVKAAATPSRPTVPVISGRGSTLPSASICSVSRNSSGV